MIYPHRGYLLIEVIKAETTTKSGVYIPDTAHEEPMYGRVLEIGKPAIKDGTIEEAPSFIVDADDENLGGRNRKLKKDDIVVFRMHAQQELIGQTDKDKKIAFVSFENVLGIKLEKEK